MKKILLISILTVVFVFQALAHCNTREGPVAKAASEALKTGNVNIVLVWVQKADENIIKDAFEKTMKLRKDPGTREMADNYFLETLVRIHRAGEGMPYTGIKDHAEPDPGLAAADQALESGSLQQVKDLLTKNMNEGLEEKFHEMMEHKNYKADEVDAGRKFVASYVTFMHYAEGIYAATQAGGHHESVSGKEHGHNNEEAVHEKATGPDLEAHDLHKGYLTNFLIIAGVLIIVAIEIIILRKK